MASLTILPNLQSSRNPHSTCSNLSLSSVRASCACFTELVNHSQLYTTWPFLLQLGMQSWVFLETIQSARSAHRYASQISCHRSTEGPLCTVGRRSSKQRQTQGCLWSAALKECLGLAHYSEVSRWTFSMQTSSRTLAFPCLLAWRRIKARNRNHHHKAGTYALKLRHTSFCFWLPSLLEAC